MVETQNFDVLVTGSAQGIGNAVVNDLVKGGARVICIAPELTSSLDFPPSVQQIQGNILEAEFVEQIVSQCGRVIHLAPLLSLDNSINNSPEILDQIIFGTRNLLMACLKYQRPILLSSNGDQYGTNSKITAAQSISETYIHALANQGLTSVILRYFNLYGSAEEPGIIREFLDCISDRQPLPLADGGIAVRSFCHIEDAAEATARLALALEADSPFCNTAMDIGSPDPITIKQLAELMIHLSGQNLGLETTATTDSEADLLVMPDLSPIQELINYQPNIDLATGLKQTLAHRELLAETLASNPPGQSIVPMVRPYFLPDRALLQSFQKSLITGQVTNSGPHSWAFERELAEFLEVPDVVIVSNGADALLLALQVLGVKGKAVLPSYTFIATLNTVIASGLEPVFCEIDSDTFTLSPSALEKILEREEGVSCVLPVNVFGVHPNLPAIARICQTAGIEIVYDNCHGFGSEVDGKRTAPEPIMQMYSFHATKVMPAIEGGAIVSPDLNLLQEIRRLRNHGIASNVVQSTPGMNAKMDELRAATGRHVLKTLPQMIEQRRQYAQELRTFFSESCHGAFIPQRVPDNMVSNFQNLGIVCPGAEQIGLNTILSALKTNGIECRSYFNPALHCLEMYQGQFQLPVTEKIWRSLVCFPIHSYMSKSDLQRIQDAALATIESLLTVSSYA